MTASDNCLISLGTGSDCASNSSMASLSVLFLSRGPIVAIIAIFSKELFGSEFSFVNCFNWYKFKVIHCIESTSQVVLRSFKSPNVIDSYAKEQLSTSRASGWAKQQSRISW